MRDLLARLDGWRGERSRREPSYVQRLTRSVIYGEGMRVRDHIPDEPSSRRRLSAWLQEKLDLLHARLAQLTGRPAEEIAEDMRRGRYLDAREALDYGLIDEIRSIR
jgi:hypothetical protein